jgi:hypothetical protein
MSSINWHINFLLLLFYSYSCEKQWCNSRFVYRVSHKSSNISNIRLPFVAVASDDTENRRACGINSAMCRSQPARSSETGDI